MKKYIFQQAPRRQMDEDESNLSDLLKHAEAGSLAQVIRDLPSEMADQLQPGSIAHVIRLLPSITLAEFVSLASEGTLPFLVCHTWEELLSPIVSVTSTLALSRVVIEALTEAQKGIISHVPVKSLIDVLKSVRGCTLGTLLSRVSREVRIPLLDSAGGHGIGEHKSKNCMLSQLPDFFQTLEPPVIDDLLHAFHHDGIRLLISNAEAEILKAILEECEPGIVADMMRLIPLGELVDMLGQCDHPNVAQIVTDCPVNAQGQFIRQLSDDDISSIFSEIRSDSSVMEPQRKKQKNRGSTGGGRKKKEGEEKNGKGNRNCYQHTTPTDNRPTQ